MKLERNPKNAFYFAFYSMNEPSIAIPDVCCAASNGEMCEITQVCANVLKTIEFDLTNTQSDSAMMKKIVLKNRKSDNLMEH